MGSSGAPMLGSTSQVGLVINQTMVEESLTKCSYAWDAQSYDRYNNGCGSRAESKDCNEPSAAFNNVCPSTHATCTASAAEVQRIFCRGSFRGSLAIAPTH